MTSIDHEPLIRTTNEKKDSNAIHFRSLPIEVTRHMPTNLHEENSLPNSSKNDYSQTKSIVENLGHCFVLDSLASIIAVHQIKCFFSAFSLFIIHWIVS